MACLWSCGPALIGRGVHGQAVNSRNSTGAPSHTTNATVTPADGLFGAITRAEVLLTRLTKDYAGVEPAASRARARLQALEAAAAGRFPSVSLEPEYELGSPDGRFVVYHKSPKEWGRLHLRDLTTGQERVLVDRRRRVGQQPGLVAGQP